MLEHRGFSLQLNNARKGKNLLVPGQRQAHSQMDRYQPTSQQKIKQARKSYEQVPIKMQDKVNNKQNEMMSRKSSKQGSINELHKKRIVEERRSYSFSNHHTKNRSYSIDRSIRKQSIIQCNTHNNTSNGKLNSEHNIVRIMSQFYRAEELYKQNVDRGDVGSAFDQLAVVLNYSVDIGNRSLFFKIVNTMCQFYELLEDHKMALKLYMQYREAALLQKDYRNFICSLIGVARCASQSKLFKEAKIILKKGLDYAWYVGDGELELSLYDELGEKYYKMGEIEKASVYHAKYADAITQPQDSPLRVLSKQQLQFLQNINLQHNYQSLSPLFIAHLSLPLKSVANLSPLFPEQYTARQKLGHNNIFDQDPHQIEYQIRRLLKSWMFSSETQQPNLEKVKQVESKKVLYNSKKYAYIDFKMNRHFRSKGIKFAPKATFQAESSQLTVRKKMSLDEQIKKLVEQPGLEKQWYQTMVKRVQIDQKRKMTQINDPVRITKNYSSSKLKMESLKHLFKQIIDQVASQKL